MEYDQAADRLENAIVELERAGNAEGSIVTGWVVVAEFLDHQGSPHLACYASRGMPWWRVNGILEAAPSAIEYVEECEDD